MTSLPISFGDLADSRISGRGECEKCAFEREFSSPPLCKGNDIATCMFYFCSPGEIVIVNEQICRHHNIAVIYISFSRRGVFGCVCGAHSRFIIRGGEGTKSRVGKGDVHRRVRYSQIILAHEHDSLFFAPTMRTNVITTTTTTSNDEAEVTDLPIPGAIPPPCRWSPPKRYGSNSRVFSLQNAVYTSLGTTPHTLFAVRFRSPT